MQDKLKVACVRASPTGYFFARYGGVIIMLIITKRRAKLNFHFSPFLLGYTYIRLEHFDVHYAKMQFLLHGVFAFRKLNTIFFFLNPLVTVYLWIKLISNMLSCSTLSVPIGIITITTASNNYALKDPHWLPLHRRYHSHESYLQFPLYFYFENLKIQECLLSNTSKMPLLYH